MRIVRQDSQGYTFMELLMDETLCSGAIKIPMSLVREAGGINERLEAGRKYELLLRIAQSGPVLFEECIEEQKEECITLLDDEAGLKEEYGWLTDCYVTGKYSVELQEAGLFDAVVSAVLNDAATAGRYEESIAWLEKMIGKAEDFHRLDRMTKPVLIYKGDDICHNVLTVFAEQFGMALERLGKQVRYFDVSAEPIRNVTRYMHQQFCAVIGVQSYMFTIKLEDESRHLHEYIYGPKYNFIFDHPIWLKNHLMHRLKDFCVLTHDQNYVNYVKTHFGYEAELFPPAGMVSTDIREYERQYDLTFVGTYNDYWSQLLTIHGMERSKRFIANHLLRIMRKNTELTSEAAFEQVVKERKMHLTDEAYTELFHEMRLVIYCIMSYYRDRVLRTILDAGICIDVYGESWENCRLNKYPNLICHPNVTVEESLVIWKKSKLALNIMSWHKGGFTERMANIMMAGAVLVTDDTTYLHDRYDENDMLIFKLQERDLLPEKIKMLLKNEAVRCNIAANGRRKAQEEHTWDKRAEQFMEILLK